MKLLADQPTVDVEEPPHRPVLAILGGVAVLVVMMGIGLVLLQPGGSDDEQPSSAADEAAEQSTDMASWTASANAACRAAGNSPLVATADDSLADVDRNVRNLVVTIREIPVPADREARAMILPIVLLGDEAETAWSGISGLDRNEISAAELDNANALTQDFVNGLIDIGADCSSLAE
ncbi:MAG TPA: hypothetical protein VFZ63_14390 [Jiangellaceae bacterium]